jgi:hypothetical protein
LAHSFLFPSFLPWFQAANSLSPVFMSFDSNNYSIILFFILILKFSTWPYFLPSLFHSFLSPSSLSLLSVWDRDGHHRQLLLIAWVWSFVVFIPVIPLLCKSFPLLICFFFFKEEN